MEFKYAIVGAGEVSNHIHIPALLKIPNTKIIAICDSDEEKAKSTAHYWNIPRYYTDTSELLNDASIDIVDICTPPSSHLAISAAALHTGKHVIIEKPMADNIDACKSICDKYNNYKNTNLKMGIIYNWLFGPTIIKLKGLIDTSLDNILNINIETNDNPYDPMISNANHWCHTFPGGRIGECLMHPIYLLQYFLGDIEIDNVWTAKRGAYQWVKYDELHVSFTAGSKHGNIYISFNGAGPGHTNVTINTRDTVLRFEGYPSTITSFSELSHNASFIKRGQSIIKTISQLSNSMISNTLRVLLKKSVSAHENYFREFMVCVATNNAAPITPEYAYKSHRIYFDLLKQLP